MIRVVDACMDLDDVALSIYRKLASHPLVAPAAGLWAVLSDEKLGKLDQWQILKGGLEAGLVPWTIANSESVLSRIRKKHDELVSLDAEAAVPCDLVRAGEIAVYVESLLADPDTMRLLKVSRTYARGAARQHAGVPAISGIRLMARQFGHFVAAFAQTVVALHECQEKVLEGEDKDPISGAHAREALFQHGKFMVEWANRYTRDMGVLQVRLDDFPAIVRQYGHAASDELVAAVYNRIHAVTRRTDWVARTACDEFTILVMGTPVEGLRILCDKVLGQIRVPAFRLGRFEIPATVSIGLAAHSAQAEGDEPTIELLLDQSARALERARSSGGNRVE